MRLLISAALSTLAAGSSLAAEATISVDIPQLNVAEYHKPYVAMWVESADGGKITNLAVWYHVKHKDNEGTKWLKDMRQWWRRTGRELTMPADGLSSPTRAPGTHQISFDSSAKPLNGLTPGQLPARDRGCPRSRRPRVAARAVRVATKSAGNRAGQGRA